MKQNCGKMNLYWLPKSSVYLLLCAVLLWACGADQGDWKQGQGFEYRLFTKDSSAARVAVGDSVWVHYGVYRAGKLLHHSKEDGAPYAFMLPPSYEQNFLDRPLMLMGLGDSIWMRLPYDSVATNLGNYQSSFESGDWVYFALTVEKVRSKEVRKAEREVAYAADRGFASVEEMRESVKTTQARSDSMQRYLQIQLKAYKEGGLRLDSLPSGLRFQLLERGTGPIAGRDSLQRVYLHYLAALQASGQVYDNSFERGDRLVFEPAQKRFIPGLRAALLAFPIGTKALVFIPSEQAYGSEGSPPFVPPSADLVFYIEWVGYQAEG